MLSLWVLRVQLAWVLVWRTRACDVHPPLRIVVSTGISAVVKGPVISSYRLLVPHLHYHL